MPNPLTDKERQKIIRYLKSGESQTRTAKMVGRSVGVVNKIAKAEGLVNIQPPKKANEARRRFSKQDRMALISYALDRGGEFLDKELTPQQYKDVMTGIAIGIDKHRLETGEVTSRGESRHRDLSGVSDKELEEFERILDDS